MGKEHKKKKHMAKKQEKKSKKKSKAEKAKKVAFEEHQKHKQPQWGIKELKAKSKELHSKIKTGKHHLSQSTQQSAELQIKATKSYNLRMSRQQRNREMAAEQEKQEKDLVKANEQAAKWMHEKQEEYKKATGYTKHHPAGSARFVWRRVPYKSLTKEERKKVDRYNRLRAAQAAALADSDTVPEA